MVSRYPGRSLDSISPFTLIQFKVKNGGTLFLHLELVLHAKIHQKSIAPINTHTANFDAMLFKIILQNIKPNQKGHNSTVLL